MSKKKFIPLSEFEDFFEKHGKTEDTISELKDYAKKRKLNFDHFEDWVLVADSGCEEERFSLIRLAANHPKRLDLFCYLVSELFGREKWKSRDSFPRVLISRRLLLRLQLFRRPMARRLLASRIISRADFRREKWEKDYFDSLRHMASLTDYFSKEFIKNNRTFLGNSIIAFLMRDGREPRKEFLPLREFFDNSIDDEWFRATISQASALHERNILKKSSRWRSAFHKIKLFIGSLKQKIFGR